MCSYCSTTSFVLRSQNCPNSSKCAVGELSIPPPASFVYTSPSLGAIPMKFWVLKAWLLCAWISKALSWACLGVGPRAVIVSVSAHRIRSVCKNRCYTLTLCTSISSILMSSTGRIKRTVELFVSENKQTKTCTICKWRWREFSKHFGKKKLKIK